MSKTEKSEKAVFSHVQRCDNGQSSKCSASSFLIISHILAFHHCPYSLLNFNSHFCADSDGLTVNSLRSPSDSFPQTHSLKGFISPQLAFYIFKIGKATLLLLMITSRVPAGYTSEPSYTMSLPCNWQMQMGCRY